MALVHNSVTRTEVSDLSADVLTILELHYHAFFDAQELADKYCQPNPCDTRAWSQILVSALSGIKGLARKKGADLADGSDVKAANVWGAIDTPRFNGCIKSGTKSAVAGKMASLDAMPLLFFVLWDHTPDGLEHRCRVWVVRTNEDSVFRRMCQSWYEQRASGAITSDNFQLHPPRNQNSNVFRNTCGNLEYPLLFEAIRRDSIYAITHHQPTVLKAGRCRKS
jgi:hypothetical protein